MRYDIDKYELTLLPHRQAARGTYRQGSAHPALSEAERLICIAPAY